MKKSDLSKKAHLVPVEAFVLRLRGEEGGGVGGRKSPFHLANIIIVAIIVILLAVIGIVVVILLLA